MGADMANPLGEGGVSLFDYTRIPSCLSLVDYDNPMIKPNWSNLVVEMRKGYSLQCFCLVCWFVGFSTENASGKKEQPQTPGVILSARSGNRREQGLIFIRLILVT